MFLRGPPFESENSDISSSKGCIAKCIAERIDGGVDIAQTIGNIPERFWNNLITRLWSKDALHDGQHVVRSPGQDEHKENG